MMMNLSLSLTRQEVFKLLRWHGALALVNALVWISCSSAYAEQGSDCSAVKVFVRTIQASEPLQGGEDEETVFKMDRNLSDLKPKLEQLPFSSFKLLSEKEQQLSLREKDIVHLPNGQSLAFRPMYMDRKRVGLWLSWKDNAGTDILNTRIHFDSDDSVLTGTDSSQDTGLILAIKAVAVR